MTRENHRPEHEGNGDGDWLDLQSHRTQCRRNSGPVKKSGQKHQALPAFHIE